MLKAKMDKSPDLARISLAVLEKAERDKQLEVNKKKAVRWMSAGLPGGTFIDAGNACEAFDLVKGREICESKNDLFESHTKANAYDQKMILDALSMYFDGKSKTLGTNYITTEITAAIEADYLNASALCPVDPHLVRTYIEQYKNAGGISKNIDSLKELQVRTYLNSSGTKDYLNNFVPDIEEIDKRDKTFRILHSAMILALERQEKCAVSKLGETNENMCKIGEDPDLKRVMNLSALGFTAKDLYRFVSFTEDRDEYFNKALNCTGEKLKIPKNLTCDTVSLIEMSKKETYQNDFVDLVSKNLEENTPLGISVCTRFFKNPEVVTLKNDQTYPCGDKKDPDYKAGEGSHAVTIIGKRCRNDQTEFLIHNSWGTGCGYYNKKYECNGKGGFWVGADVLSKNARLLNILK